MPMSDFTLKDLEQIIAERGHSTDGNSWTAKLLSSGMERCAKKMGEEAVETVIAAMSGNRQELRDEAADLLYHLLVVLKAGDVSLEEVFAELERRTSQSGIAEKASRDDS